MVLIQDMTVQTVDEQFEKLTDLLISVVENGASVNFVLPLSRDVARKFWHQVRDAVQTGEKIVLVAMDGDNIAGSVQLGLAWQPNGQHRAEVQKLIVHPDYRRQGVARMLMSELERIARERGRMTLFLDTEKDSIAEGMYAKLGYQRCGEIPQFALNPYGEMKSTVLFYKLLV